MQIIDFSVCITSTDTTMRYCLAELILKLGLNTISTGAHVLKGKIYQNIMIDVRVRYFPRSSDAIFYKFNNLVISNYSIVLLVLSKYVGFRF